VSPPKQKRTRLGAFFALSRFDKKDATLKMAKSLVLYCQFFFSRLDGWWRYFAKSKF
jgi:hypothetical protein